MCVHEPFFPFPSIINVCSLSLDGINIPVLLKFVEIFQHRKASAVKEKEEEEKRYSKSISTSVCAMHGFKDGFCCFISFALSKQMLLLLHDTCSRMHTGTFMRTYTFN